VLGNDAATASQTTGGCDERPGGDDRAGGACETRLALWAGGSLLVPDQAGLAALAARLDVQDPGGALNASVDRLAVTGG